MRIAICEDEARHRTELEANINVWKTSNGHSADISCFENAEMFLAAWSEKCSFDLIFLDIQMGLLSGIELAEIIRRTDESMIIVFLTSYKDFVLRGYEVRALRYLLKPIRKSDCFDVLDRSMKIYSAIKNDVFIIPIETQSVRLLLNDIYYFESQGHTIEVHTNRGLYKYRDKISAIEQNLPSPHFYRCHRSYLVNMYHVHLINIDKLQLDNEEILPVAKNRWRSLNHAFLIYHGRT